MTLLSFATGVLGQVTTAKSEMPACPAHLCSVQLQLEPEVQPYNPGATGL